MKVKELIAILEECDENKNVKLEISRNYIGYESGVNTILEDEKNITIIGCD